MDETDPRRGERVLVRFPKIAVKSQRDMARVLGRYRWLLEAIAHQHLGETPQAQEAVNTVVSQMLAIKEPDLEHALRAITRALHYQCKRITEQQARPPSEAEIARAEGIPYDDVHGRVVGGLALAVAQLPPAERRAFDLAAKGVGVTEIAAALNLNPRTVQMQLYRARRRLRRLTGENPALLGPMVFSLRNAWRRLTGRSAAPREAAARWLGIGGGGPPLVPQLGDAAVLVSLAALSLASASPAAEWPPAYPPALAASASLPSGAVTSSTPRTAGPARSGQPGPQSLLSIPLPRLPVPFTARAKSPEDTRVVAVAPAPHYQENRTVVALGEDPACPCLFLFRSSDGGRSWSTAPGPANGAQLALPPDYPHDPRILIGNPAGVAGASDYVLDHFDGTYTPLPGPSGMVAVDGAFDDGTPDVYVATSLGVISVDMQSGAASATVLSSGVWGQASLATRPGTDGVVAAVPRGSVAPGATAVGWPSGTTASSLMGCHGAACSRLSGINAADPLALVVSATYALDHSIAAYGGSEIFLSTDAGADFSPVRLSPAPTTIWSVALQAGRLWIAGARGVTPFIGWIPVAGGSWHELSPGQPSPENAGTLVALGSDRLVYIGLHQGLLCSADGGSTWAAACPAT